MSVWPTWTTEQLAVEREKAIGVFRQQRLVEPLEAYLDAFDEFLGDFENLIEKTVDLTKLEDNALAILSDKKLKRAFRYLAGPPISEDDLKTLAEAKLSRSQLRANPEMVTRLLGVISEAFDRRRFLWLAEQREPEDAERTAAIHASAALMATQKVATLRRNESKKAQEAQVEETLIKAGLQNVARREVPTFAKAPKAGEFCRESKLGGHKADFIVGLWDDRIMGIECKVSNSAVNSFKRIVKEAAGKATNWDKKFGEQVVSIAVIGGVFSVANLLQAQDQGLGLCWAHDLPNLEKWLGEVKAASEAKAGKRTSGHPKT